MYIPKKTKQKTKHRDKPVYVLNAALNMFVDSDVTAIYLCRVYKSRVLNKREVR